MIHRQLILDEAPASVGAAWASALCETFRQQGRTITGGWPGTVLEARNQIAQHLHEVLTARRLAPPVPEELATATSATYSRAKQDWLAMERTAKLRRRRDAS